MGCEYSESPVFSESGRSVLESHNLIKISTEIKKKSEKYPVKMG
jgi:hypothetical protein